MLFSAIDIGSNAVRLLVSHVFEVGDWVPVVRKADLYRVPVRLGVDAFGKGRITDVRADQLVHTMTAFRHIMKAVGSEDYMACATSALRSADNGGDVVERVLRETGVQIELIDGAREAELIALNRLDGRFQDGPYLYIDVGGGSTELTLLDNNRPQASRSFNIGTVRLKEGLVDPLAWKEMEQWVRQSCKGVVGLRAIGSGGNINKLFKMTRKRQDKPLPRKTLATLHHSIAQLSLEERMIELGLKPDRADVIVPAGKIYLSVTLWAAIKQIYVPQIGLADGIIRELYRRWAGRINPPPNGEETSPSAGAAPTAPSQATPATDPPN